MAPLPKRAINTMPDAILVLNSGSSSIKFGVFEVSTDNEPVLMCSGLLDEHDAEPRMTIKDHSGKLLVDRHRAAADKSEQPLLVDILDWVDSTLARDTLVAVGHRVVHGGADFVAPVEMDGKVLGALHALTPLAPLHQPRCLSPVEAIMSLRPGLPQIACFDTAFHHGLAPSIRRFAIPRRFDESGIRRYGFHGLSFEFIARRLAEISPELANKRTVVAHLGNGASLCAMRDGASIDTTMGLTPLDGLMMGTRCGAIDPGVLLYLQQGLGMSVGDVERVLYQESGLLGVSGISSDMRVLLASGDPDAAEAVELFNYRVAREIAAMANSLSGLECLVFTGGIGEHASQIRQAVCERLRWLGAEIDSAANDRADMRIHSAASRVDLLVIPTNEEATIARNCLALLNSRRRKADGPPLP
jgi:acetate kinase